MNNEKFALITGSSEGIGKGFAYECASRGMNILMVALPGIELEKTKNAIKSKYNVKIDALGIDLTETDAPKKVFNWCQENKYFVDVLINNAGIAGTTKFEESSLEYSDMRIQLNIRALVLLCRYFIPEMKKQTKANILNVSSLSAFYAIPYKSIYSATKVFVYQFSRAIREELYDSSVSVSVVCPNGVYSNEGTFARIAAHGNKGRATAISIDKLVSTTIDKMLKGQSVIIPKFVNRLLVFIGKLIPGNLKQKLLRNEFKKEVNNG